MTFKGPFQPKLFCDSVIENCLPGDFRPTFLTSKFSLNSPLSQYRLSFTSLQFWFLLFLLCFLLLLEIDASVFQSSFSAWKEVP